ncbi:MAG TPA: glycosyltransferase family 2 protein [Azospirillaceae bacterium]|nr:glycosyltransferase family 2 protein [Azospirillaceae bacterium]
MSTDTAPAPAAAEGPAPGAPAISAVICTHNRADHLRRAVASLQEQTLPADRFEIIVVDNGSTDATRDVVEEFAGAPHPIRYIYEPVLGLSRARNTGWRRSRAPLVAYLDDDAIAAPDWLERLVESFRAEAWTAGCVGGLIEGNWEAPRPGWLHDVLLPCLTVIDWKKDAPAPVTKGCFVAGANIAFRRDLLERAGGFAENLGRKGGSLLSAEERDMTERVEALGFCTVYDPRAAVKHWVGRDRLTKRWFLERARWQGISEAAAEMNRGTSPLRRAALAAAAMVRVQFLKNLLLTAAAPLAEDQPRLFVARFDVVRHLAFARSMLRGLPPEVAGSAAPRQTAAAAPAATAPGA